MRIGIVIPAWNVAATLPDTIRSVLAQTHEDWRLVVVDDGSTDATASVAAGFADDRVTLLRQANTGVSTARNVGFAVLDTTIEAVLFLDGDDRLAADAVARLTAGLAAAPEAIAVVGAYAMAGRVRCPPFGDLVYPLLQRNHFANPGHVLIRRGAAERVGPFRPGLAYGEDWDYLIRLAMLGPFATTLGRAPVLHVTVRPGGACHRMASDPAAFRACLDVIFGNEALLSRFGPMVLARLRDRAEAESHWIIGRELIRHGRNQHGRAWLRRSVGAMPGPRRLALLTAAHLLPLLPRPMRGPFVPYAER